MKKNFEEPIVEIIVIEDVVTDELEGVGSNNSAGEI